MKKYLLLFAAAAVALGAAAGQMSKKSVSLFKAERANLQATAIHGPNRVITTQPAGELVKYNAVMNGVYTNSGYYSPASDLEGEVAIVFDANGQDVYFKNILLQESTFGESWVKGTLSADGSSITVATEQSLYYSTSYSADVMLRWGSTNIGDNSIVFTQDASVTEVVFNVDESGVISLEGGANTGTGNYAAYIGTGLSCQWTDDDSFGGYIAWGLKLIPDKNLNADDINVEPAATSANVSWQGNEATSWNLRYRPVSSALSYDFEDESQFAEWALIDADGDGNNWELSLSGDTYVAGSASYINNVGAVTPDNWLISPAVEIKAGDKVVFKAWGQDADWAGEHFAVYATNGDPSDPANFTQISDELIATGAPTEYSFDLSAFAGTAHVAFRHYNITDMFRLNIDDVQIGLIYDWVEVDGLEDNAYTIEGLDPATDYEVQIQGLLGERQGEWSESTLFTTDVEFFVVGAFNEWSVADALKLEKNEDGILSATFDVEGEAEALEFKIATPDDEAEEAAQGMKWFGGVDEYENHFFLVTEELLDMDLTVVSPGVNFRLPEAGNYTILLQEAAEAPAPAKRISADSELVLIVQKNGATAVADLNADRAASVHYVNLAGQVSATPFNGVNIQVTTMKDGSKKAVKVVK